ncbi:MAG TPA: transketolase C-terminal domain-containing protein [Candidatus Micrarchaeia archaeon]|nr:transketolase C-terminal domain-containing protein [Candidatus Micrarchaeia archaeon]
MRAEAIAALVELAELDSRVVLLTADLGFTVVEPFADRYPDRFINVGVAENNMIGIATGLASEGLLPFCYSIAAFLSMRCFEAFRDGPVVHSLPVRLLAVGGGVGYGVSGITHYAIEDVALMRSSDRVAIYAPPTSLACSEMVRHSYAEPGPIYYRLAKDAVVDSRVPAAAIAQDGFFMYGRGPVALITYGRMAAVSLDAVDRLRQVHGTDAQCAVVARLDPGTLHAALAAVQGYDYVVTVEDHTIHGGIGSMVAECMAEGWSAGTLRRLGLGSEVWSGNAGSETYLLGESRLTAADICTSILQLRVREPSPCG